MKRNPRPLPLDKRRIREMLKSFIKNALNNRTTYIEQIKADPDIRPPIHEEYLQLFDTFVDGAAAPPIHVRLYEFPNEAVQGISGIWFPSHTRISLTIDHSYSVDEVFGLLGLNPNMFDDLYSVLLHETTHARDYSVFEDYDSGLLDGCVELLYGDDDLEVSEDERVVCEEAFRQYYNNPGEVVAWIQETVNAIEREDPDRDTYREFFDTRALRRNYIADYLDEVYDEWETISQYLTDANKRKIWNVVYQYIQDN